MLLANVAKFMDCYKLHETIMVYDDSWVDNLQQRELEPQASIGEMLSWISSGWAITRSGEFKQTIRIAEMKNEE